MLLYSGLQMILSLKYQIILDLWLLHWLLILTLFFYRTDRKIQFLPMNNIVSVLSSGIPIDWKYLGANFFCSSLFQRVQVSDCKRYLLTFLLDLNGDRWIRRGFIFLRHCCFLCFFLGGFRKKSHDVGDSRVSNIQLNQLWPSPSFNHRTALRFVRVALAGWPDSPSNVS